MKTSDGYRGRLSQNERERIMAHNEDHFSFNGKLNKGCKPGNYVLIVGPKDPESTTPNNRSVVAKVDCIDVISSPLDDKQAIAAEREKIAASGRNDKGSNVANYVLGYAKPGAPIQPLCRKAPSRISQDQVNAIAKSVGKENFFTDGKGHDLIRVAASVIGPDPATGYQAPSLNKIDMKAPITAPETYKSHTAPKSYEEAMGRQALGEDVAKHEVASYAADNPDKVKGAYPKNLGSVKSKAELGAEAPEKPAKSAKTASRPDPDVPEAPSASAPDMDAPSA